VQHGAHINVGGIVAPHIREEVATYRGNRTDDQLGTLYQLADDQIDACIAQKVEGLGGGIAVGRVDRLGGIHAGSQRVDDGNAGFVDGVLVNHGTRNVAHSHLRADKGLALSVHDAERQLKRAGGFSGLGQGAFLANRLGQCDALHRDQKHKKQRKEFSHRSVTPFPYCSKAAFLYPDSPTGG